MKKVIATIFLLVYFVTTSGATIQFHYCMNKLVGWNVNSHETSKCGKCGMEKKSHKGCCHDESRFIKLDKVHKASFNFFDFSKVQSSVNTTRLTEAGSVKSIKPIISYLTSNAPPKGGQVPIYLFDSVFRI